MTSAAGRNGPKKATDGTDSQNRRVAWNDTYLLLVLELVGQVTHMEEHVVRQEARANIHKIKYNQRQQRADSQGTPSNSHFSTSPAFGFGSDKAANTSALDRPMSM